MPKKNLFKKNGKTLKTYQDYESVTSLMGVNTPQESILSLSRNTPNRENIPTIAPTTLREHVKGIRNQILEQKNAVTGIGVPTWEALQEKPRQIFEKMRQEIATIRESKVFVLPSVWIASNIALTLLVGFLLTTNTSIQQKTTKYSIFSSKPLTLGTSSIRLFGGDSRSAKLDSIFKSYKCPLAGKGKVFVREADKYDIPYWIVAAISFQESSCGKKTPKVDGEETYNAWGWGVWGTNKHGFDDWDAGIERVSRYLGENFFSREVTDTCEIMKTYTPPSNGSWCSGVNFFGDIIQNYETPQ